MRVPFKNFDHDWKLAASQVRRDFEELENRWPSGATPYNAVIDSSLTNSYPAQHLYKNLTELVAAETWAADSTFNVAVRGNVNLPITEPAGSGSTAITLKGNLYMSCLGEAAYGAGRAVGVQRWNLNGNFVSGNTSGTVGSNGIALWCDGLEIYNAGTVVTTPFYKAHPTYGGTLVLTNCRFEFSDYPASAVRSFNGASDWAFYARNSLIIGNPINTTDSLSMSCNWVQVDMELHEDVTFKGTLWWDGGNLTGMGFAKTITLNSALKKFIRIKNGAGLGGAGGSSTDVFSIGASQTAEWFLQNDGQFGTNTMNVTVAAGAADGQVYGKFRAVTWAGTNAKIFRGWANNACDFTGPGKVDLQAVLGSGVRVTLRGVGLHASINVDGAATPIVQCLNLDYSEVLLNVKGAGQPITLDASSQGNVVVLGGDADTANFSAYTDSGTFNRILNYLGTAPTGAAGGDLTGTYPNPTIAANAVTNTKAADMAANSLKGNNTAGVADPLDLTVAQVKTLLSFIASGDAAGGVLSGTYPNPGFAVDMATQAELDAAVAADTKDFNKMFMGMA